MEGLSHKESEYGLEMSEQENTVILTFPCSLWQPTVSSRPISTKSGRGGYRLVLDEHSTCKITINHDVGWLSVASNNNICVSLISVHQRVAVEPKLGLPQVLIVA